VSENAGIGGINVLLKIYQIFAEPFRLNKTVALIQTYGQIAFYKNILYENKGDFLKKGKLYISWKMRG
jgi:hypothetical protein